MDIKKIAIIGAGELGSRHLQGLSKCDFPVDIQVLDPSEQSLSTAKARFAQMPVNSNVRSIEYINDLRLIGQHLDLAIISTNSNIRLSVLKQLLEITELGNVLLEKVLFQSLAELDQAELLLSTHQVQAYVNCPKRGFESSKIIQKKVKDSKFLSYEVTGESWGLGCNAIHFLDNMAYYTGESSYSLDTKGIDRVLVASKRPGFIEFSGELIATFGADKKLKLVSGKAAEVSFRTEIESDSFRFRLDEKQGSLNILNKEMNTESNLVCPTPFQSALTGSYAQKIIFGKHVSLPSYSMSAALHRPLLSGLLKIYNDIEGKMETHLPVT